MEASRWGRRFPLPNDHERVEETRLTIKTTRRSFLATAAPLAILAQEPHRAYDESKVRPYTLPDPLVFANGRKVASRADWERRRIELLRLFEENVYGRSPGAM